MSAVRTVRVVGMCVVAMLLTLADAGCRSDDGRTREQRPLTNEEWRTVIADWYEDGDFDRTHRCLAVRAARRHLPSRSPGTQPLHEDFRALEAGAC